MNKSIEATKQLYKKFDALREAWKKNPKRSSLSITNAARDVVDAVNKIEKATGTRIDVLGTGEKTSPDELFNQLVYSREIEPKKAPQPGRLVLMR